MSLSLVTEFLVARKYAARWCEEIPHKFDSQSSKLKTSECSKNGKNAQKREYSNDFGKMKPHSTGFQTRRW